MKKNTRGTTTKAKGSFFKKPNLNLKKHTKNLSKFPKGEMVLIAWIIFSILYVAQGVYGDFKSLPVEQAYSQGRTDTINNVITSSKKCQPFNVTSQLGAAQLINIACLKQAQAQPEATGGEGQ